MDPLSAECQARAHPRARRGITRSNPDAPSAPTPAAMSPVSRRSGQVGPQASNISKLMCSVAIIASQVRPTFAGVTRTVASCFNAAPASSASNRLARCRMAMPTASFMLARGSRTTRRLPGGLRTRCRAAEGFVSLRDSLPDWAESATARARRNWNVEVVATGPFSSNSASAPVMRSSARWSSTIST